MMKGKRLLSVILMLAMTVSLLTGITVNAAAPLQFEGATTVLFDQNFAGLKSAAGAPDFTFKNGNGGTWTFTDYFAISKKSDGTSTAASVVTKNSYDLTDASGFELVVKAECTSNGMTISMPGDYALKWHNNSGGAGVSGKNKILALTIDGAVPAADADGNVPYVRIDAYDADTTYKIKYLDGVWNVEAITTTAEKTGTETASFTWKDTSNPTFKGTFGIAANYTGKFTVYSMKLTKFANTATVNHWKYEKKFSSADSTDSLKDEGYTFSATDFTVNDNGIKSINNNRNVTFRPYGKDFCGSYYFETAIQRSQNECWVSFNKSSNGYYRLVLPKASTDNNLYLKKYDAATKETHTLVSQPFTNNTNGIITTYKVKVENLTDGSIKITVDAVYGSTVIPTFTYTDTDTETLAVTTTTTDAETGETVETTEYVDTGAPLTSGVIQADWRYCGSNSYLKYINAHSIVTDADKAASKPITYSDVVIDKTFTSADTVTSLASEGITAPSGKTIDDSGIHSESSAVTYTGALGDDYSFSARMYRQWNNSEIRFGYNGSDYYSVASHYGSASNKYIRITRSGTTISENEIASGTSDTTKYGYCNWSTYDVDVTTNADTGVKTIVLTFNCEGNVTTITATDSTPITDGANVNMYANSSGIVSDFALTKYAYGEYPEVLTAKTMTSAATTVDELTAEGYTVPSSANLDDYLTIGTSNFDYTAENLDGNYKMSTKVYRGYNGSSIYFDYVDSSNYYLFTYKNHNTAVHNFVKLQKVKGGQTYTVWSLADELGLDDCSTLSSANKGHYVITNFDVTAKTDAATGNKTFTINYKPTGGTARNFTYVDYNNDADAPEGQIADGGAPVNGNKFRIKHDNAGRVYNFNVTKYISSSWYSGEDPLYIGRFYSSNGVILSPVNGAIYFEYPTALLGNYKVVATLHENNEMTGIKVISPVELYAGKVKLFTVTDAANAKVRVYFFDDEETLNRITEVYELN